MNCDAVLGLMDDWLDGAIDATQRDAIERHLSMCEACRAAFEAQRRLAMDLATLGGAANAIAVGGATSVTRAGARRSGWGTPLRIAAAIVLAVGATWLAKDVMWPALDQKRPPQIAERGNGDTTDSNSDKPRIELASDRNQMTVELKSSNPRIHIVWLYDTPGQGADNDEEATSAPASLT